MKWINPKYWLKLIMGKVVGKKVIGKIAKHGSTAIVGLILSDKVAPYIQPVMDAMKVSEAQLETGLLILCTGLIGGLWNYLSHRILD